MMEAGLRSTQRSTQDLFFRPCALVLAPRWRGKRLHFLALVPVRMLSLDKNQEQEIS